MVHSTMQFFIMDLSSFTPTRKRSATCAPCTFHAETSQELVMTESEVLPPGAASSAARQPLGPAAAPRPALTLQQARHQHPGASPSRVSLRLFASVFQLQPNPGREKRKCKTLGVWGKRKAPTYLLLGTDLPVSRKFTACFPSPKIGSSSCSLVEVSSSDSAPQGHLVMAGDILGGHSGRGCYRVEAEMQENIPQGYFVVRDSPLQQRIMGSEMSLGTRLRTLLWAR